VIGFANAGVAVLIAEVENFRNGFSTVDGLIKRINFRGHGATSNARHPGEGPDACVHRGSPPSEVPYRPLAPGSFVDGPLALPFGHLLGFFLGSHALSHLGKDTPLAAGAMEKSQG
jgi:hypothetical protein